MMGQLGGAGGRNRTDMSLTARWILSPVRLPVSPRRRVNYNNPNLSDRQGEILSF